MKKQYGNFLIICMLSVCNFQSLSGQNITITDTIKHSQPVENLKSGSSFIVEGEVAGMDSGSIKIYSPGGSLSVYVPLKQGRFYFSGLAKSVEKVNFLITGDYYVPIFYLEPGKIKINYNIDHHKLTASGTKENDLYNYFITLNKKNSERFWYLSKQADIFLKEGKLSPYMKVIDSFTLVEIDFFKTVNEAISKNKSGFYLLGCVNNYYINYGYFSERQAMFESLPGYIKNSEAGKETLTFLENTKRKNASHTSEDAYQFNLKALNNQELSLKDFKDKIIVLDFWASWCAPCIKALPLLKEIQANDVSKNVVYISVSIDKKENDWREKERVIHIPWLSLLADEPTIKNYEVDTVPSYVVINKEGKIVNKSSSLASLYVTLKKLKK